MKMRVSKEVNIMKKSKLSATKEFFEEYGFYILLYVLLVVGIILVIVLPLCLSPTNYTQGTVTAVGYKGVMVEYKGEYGQDCTKKVNVDDVSEYQIGDTVTIEIKGLNVKIVEETVVKICGGESDDV